MPLGDVPEVEARRRGGGGNFSGGGIGDFTVDDPRGLGGNGVAVFSLVSVRGVSDLDFAERRGGGRLGLGFSCSCACSCSCSSCADTNEEGEEGTSLLPKDDESLL